MTSSHDAKYFAQFIAMAPFVFQTAICLRDFGIMKCLTENPKGRSFEDLLEISKLSRYSLDVLLDAGVSSGMISEEKDIYLLTQTGFYLENDEITKVNMNFSQDVCYQGLFSLGEALKTNTPAGLKVFGEWETIYQGLSQLPEKAKKSWFEFDHFFSDHCFSRALPILFKENPKKILDIGGNTGRFSVAATRYSPTVRVTLVDHPTQIQMAKEFVSANEVTERVSFFATDLLNSHESLPTGHDLIWMSQFLCCFSSDEVVQILRRAREVMDSEGHLFIMESFTDNQRFDTAKFCLDMTSLYFTAMANGNSRMYPSQEFYQLIERAGLKIIEIFSNVRLNHTILKCQRI